MSSLPTASNNNKATIRSRKVPSRRRKDGLIQYAKNNTSQGGEDGIIDRIFELLPSPSSSSSLSSYRYCVDVGAWDGVHLSNTHSLLVPPTSPSTAKSLSKQGGEEEGQQQHQEQMNGTTTLWKGILIEAVTDRFQSLQKLHKPFGNACINASVSCLEKSPFSLPSILKPFTANSTSTTKELSLPTNFDFLCIDVDGPDYWLWYDMLQNNYRPKVVCIEFNPTMPHDIIYIQPRNDSIRHGSSLTALVELAQLHQYVLVETTMFNAFFVDETLYDQYLKSEVPDVTIESLHEVTMGTILYQLYDGTIKLSGCKKMLWHRIPIEEEDVQVLPMEKRDFPFAPNSSSSDGAEVGVSSSLGLDPKREEEAKKVGELAVDMSPYCNTNDQNTSPKNDTAETIQTQKSTCANALYTQLQKNGFAYVKGTSIPPTLCQAALQATNLFLNDAEEEVRRSCLTKDRARRGYSPMCTENFASLVGEEGPNDLVRKFRVGPILDEEEEKAEGEAATEGEEEKEEKEQKLPSLQSPPASSSPLLRPNVWPNTNVWDEESISYFRTSIESYYKESCRVAHSIVRAISDGLLQSAADANGNIDTLSASVDALLQSSMTMMNSNDVSGKEDFLSSDDNNDTSILTLLGYQKGSRHKQHGKQIRPLVAPHTDVGVVTFLLFDEGNSATLQRIDKGENNNDDDDNQNNNKWVDVILPRIENDCDPIFVINIGDCLSELSHGMLPSTLHRVIPKVIQGGGKKGKKKMKKMTGAAETTTIVPRNCLALFVGLEPSRILTLPASSPTVTMKDDDSNNNDDDLKDCGEEQIKITYEEWRKRRIARAAKVLREKSNLAGDAKK